MDRLAKFVIHLEEKISEIETTLLTTKFKNEECVDLVEEGFIQASRALTECRREQIASVLKNGLKDEEVTYGESKYLLKILQELNENEIIWLRFYLVPVMTGDGEYRSKHKNVLDPVRVHDGSEDSTIEKAALQESYKEHLERLGLIRSHYQMDRENGTPKLNYNGKPKVSRRDLSALGRLLLKHIGLIDA